VSKIACFQSTKCVVEISKYVVWIFENVTSVQYSGLITQQEVEDRYMREA